MKIELDLTVVPDSCWWWTALTGYLLLSYLVLGPILSRTYYKWWKGKYERTYGCDDTPEGDAFGLWLFSPLTVPATCVRYLSKWFVVPPVKWLIYGSSK